MHLKYGIKIKKLFDRIYLIQQHNINRMSPREFHLIKQSIIVIRFRFIKEIIYIAQNRKSFFKANKIRECIATILNSPQNLLGLIVEDHYAR